MAISKDGGSNPTKVIYNGKNVTKVLYRSNPEAEAVQVWPEDTPKVYLIQNYHPELRSEFITHDPQWENPVVLSQKNPFSVRFESPNSAPFIETFSRRYKSDLPEGSISYWTFEKPNGEISTFNNLDTRQITINQAGTYIQNNYYADTPTPTPITSGTAFIYNKGFPYDLYLVETTQSVNIGGIITFSQSKWYKNVNSNPKPTWTVPKEISIDSDNTYYLYLATSDGKIVATPMFSRKGEKKSFEIKLSNVDDEGFIEFWNNYYPGYYYGGRILN